MKKLMILAVLAMAFASCSSPAKLMNSSTHKKMVVAQPLVAVFADLDVSPTKITYFMMPSKTVRNGGYENVVNSAVREALLANGDADVLVGLETQVKYGSDGLVESITVSGYPAKYVNFRNAGDEYLKNMQVPAENSTPSLFGKLGK